MGKIYNLLNLGFTIYGDRKWGGLATFGLVAAFGIYKESRIFHITFMGSLLSDAGSLLSAEVFGKIKQPLHQLPGSTIAKKLRIFNIRFQINHCYKICILNAYASYISLES